VSQQTVSQQTVSQQTVSQQTVSQQTVSQQTVSQQTVSQQTVSPTCTGCRNVMFETETSPISPFELGERETHDVAGKRPAQVIGHRPKITG